jgi:hypothetical protein
LIRAVGNKRLDLSDSEYKYYCTLKEQFGESDFVGLFETDKNGIITSVNPPMNKNISFGVLFFLLNIMMNQRVRVLDGKINKVTDFEIKVDNFLKVHNIIERLEQLEKQNLKEEN